MNNLPKVSVIVPVYNSENKLESCIQSILNADYPEGKKEIIFVDNASNERTKNILDLYKDIINILYENKRGAAAARNRGILNSTGEVIAFTDSDCVVDEKWLLRIVEPLVDDNVGIAGGRILAKKPCNNIEKFGEKIHDHKKAIIDAKIPYVITMNWASRSSVLKKMGLFNEDLIRCQDIDLSRKIFYEGYKIVYVNDAVIYHSNRKTLSALFYQGYIHGFWGVKLSKIQKPFLDNYDYSRFNFDSYKSIMSRVTNFIIDRSSSDSLFYSVFNIGKKTGKFMGSIRFFYLEL